MIYDAVLVARRGLGPEELRLGAPRFLAAVRWAVYAEKLFEPVPELEVVVARDPVGLNGQALLDAIAARGAARELVAAIRGELLLIDEAPAVDPEPESVDGS